MKKLLLLLLTSIISLSLFAEGYNDYNLDFGCAALQRSFDELENERDAPTKFRMYQLISPASPIVLGSLVLYMTKVEDLDMSWSDRISSGHGKLTFDDYLQYSPVFVMWGLDALPGYEPYHKFKQQTTVLAMSAVTSLLLVQGIKNFVDRRRPDTGATNSFPSGHTATAFLCAEMLHKEFGHYSPWISIAGYTAAAVTGYMRVYNERHYIGDIVAGAGVGMLSARLAYWAAPSVNRWLWGSETGYENEDFSAVISPAIIGESVGLGLSISF